MNCAKSPTVLDDGVTLMMSPHLGEKGKKRGDEERNEKKGRAGEAGEAGRVKG